MLSQSNEVSISRILKKIRKLQYDGIFSFYKKKYFWCIESGRSILYVQEFLSIFMQMDMKMNKNSLDTQYTSTAYRKIPLCCKLPQYFFKFSLLGLRSTRTALFVCKLKKIRNFIAKITQLFANTQFRPFFCGADSRVEDSEPDHT